MKQIHSLLKYSLVLGCVLAPDSVLGQIVPDATLRVNSSVTQSSNKFTINGGTVVGGNLFHSFQNFNVPTGTEAFFNNAPTIENIFTRVTGGRISNIDGILRANGSANLFLLNPSGIIFGPNASLNIGGSFIGSSAMSIKFADGTQFSATNSQAVPLLTVSVPIGLQFGSNPGAIAAQGTKHDLTIANSGFSPFILTSNSIGLQVRPGKTLALVGGDVNLNGGTLTAERGRIELGSVGEAGLVSVSPTTGGFALDYAGVSSFGDIRFSQQALVNVSGASAGSIQVQGRQVSLKDGSVVWSQNRGTQPGGSISVHATQLLELIGDTPNGKIPSTLTSETVGVGTGSDIAIATKQLSLLNGSYIFSETFSAAASGNINVNATESVLTSGFLPNHPNVPTIISSRTLSTGKAGDVMVSTERLSLLNGANVGATTFSKGSGGSLTVNAEAIEVVGAIPNLFSSTLGAGSFGAGNAGNITLNTRTLSVRDGGAVSTSSYNTGSAGSITINAKESVLVSGNPVGTPSPSQIKSAVTVADPFLQNFFGVPARPSGASGNVTINTPVLKVTDGARVSVRNEGVGSARTLQVNAATVLLDQLGSLTASTTFGEGGNITLHLKDSLQLRNGSQITTNAQGIDSNGGNISIDTGTLVARENSDITANSEASFGGRVIINAKGIFGTQYRPQLTPQSDITASSSLGASFSGVVQLNTADVDPSSTFVALPATVIDPSHQITAGCSAQKGNNFVVTGQGGLPENPTSTLRGVTLWADLRRVGGVGEVGGVGGEISSSSPSSPDSPIIEATGWVVDEYGQVELVAQAPQLTKQQPWQKTPACGEI